MKKSMEKFLNKSLASLQDKQGYSKVTNLFSWYGKKYEVIIEEVTKYNDIYKRIIKVEMVIGFKEISA